jgi:putative methionine-R-sulfoxide reductase with GAF domain
LFDEGGTLDDTGSTCNMSQTSENSIPVMSKRNFEGYLAAESMLVHQFSKKSRSELVGNDELMKDEDKEDTATTSFR